MANPSAKAKSSSSSKSEVSCGQGRQKRALKAAEFLSGSVSSLQSVEAPSKNLAARQSTTGPIVERAIPKRSTKSKVAINGTMKKPAAENALSESVSSIQSQHIDDSHSFPPTSPLGSSRPRLLMLDNSASSTAHTAKSSASQHQAFIGVKLRDTVGSLTLTSDRLVFKPNSRNDKEHIYACPLDSLQKHQISAAEGGGEEHACLLKLVSQAHPNKTVTMKFPDRASLEQIHSNLSAKMQPLRKYRKLKETLLATQRKLKEANKTIDELQDTNQKLLDSCEAFAKKCKRLSHELQAAQEGDIQRFVANDKLHELEQQLRVVQPELDSLRNEKTAIKIEHEMDVQNYEARIAELEKELEEERAALKEEREALDQTQASLEATTDQLLEERQPLEELQLEISVLAKEVLTEKRTAATLRNELALQEKQSDLHLWQVRRQRNNAFLELAHVKKERDRLQDEVVEHERIQEKARLQAAYVEDDDDDSIRGLDCLTVSTADEPFPFLANPEAKAPVANNKPQRVWHNATFLYHRGERSIQAGATQFAYHCPWSSQGVPLALVSSDEGPTRIHSDVWGWGGYTPSFPTAAETDGLACDGANRQDLCILRHQPASPWTLSGLLLPWESDGKCPSLEQLGSSESKLSLAGCPDFEQLTRRQPLLSRWRVPSEQVGRNVSLIPDYGTNADVDLVLANPSNGSGTAIAFDPRGYVVKPTSTYQQEQPFCLPDNTPVGGSMNMSGRNQSTWGNEIF